jgi:hypothetical protein
VAVLAQLFFRRLRLDCYVPTIYERLMVPLGIFIYLQKEESQLKLIKAFTICATSLSKNWL